MSTQNDGGPAFPGIDSDGASLRDLFAMASLQGYCAASGSEVHRSMLLEIADEKGLSIQEVLAHMAYVNADAMLKARER